MSLILIEKIHRFAEDTEKGFEGKLEMIDTEEIKGIRPWRLKGTLSEKFPKDFSLITLKDGKEIKVAQDIELLDQRINGLKKIHGES